MLSLMFTGKGAGRAEEAVEFYISVFKGSRHGIVARYGKGREPDEEGTLVFTDFALGGQWFAAVDSARPHGFGFNEVISLLIPCETQKEIDHYWERLSADPRLSSAAGSRTSLGCRGRSGPRDGRDDGEGKA